MICITTQAAIVAYVALFMPEHFFPGFLAVITALSLGWHICMFGVQTSIARKNSSMFHLVAFMVILFPAATPVFIGLQHLPRPVVTAAEREQLEERVQREAETYSKTEAFRQPEKKQQLLAGIRNRLNPGLAAPPAKAYVAWSCAALLTAAGLAAFLDARKRWLKLELG
jgi:hypothetical protein